MPGEWYDGLDKPPGNPPGWVFGPVWTALYLMIAVAGWRIWRVQRRWRPALWLWLAQLLANALWSYLFFGLQRPGLALVDITVLLVLIAWTIVRFKPIDHLAAWLMVPYWLWVFFATYLNASLWYLNR